MALRGQQATVASASLAFARRRACGMRDARLLINAQIHAPSLSPACAYASPLARVGAHMHAACLSLCRRAMACAPLAHAYAVNSAYRGAYITRRL